MNIPIESREMIDTFLADQKAKEYQRGIGRSNNLLEQPMKLVGVIKTTKSRELEKLARGLGFDIKGGNGNHGVHIIAPSGRRWPLPVHKGRKELSNGTRDDILAFIEQNRQAERRCY